MMEKLDKWNKVKKKTEVTVRNTIYKQREIFWLRIGQNVGYEEYGKGNEFQRPILIVRKLTRDLFIGVPLTSKIKEENDYFVKISFKTKKGISENMTMLLQLRVYDKKRLMGKEGTLDKDQFNKVIEKCKGLFIPS